MHTNTNITIQDLAERTGLSTSTVSRALNESYGVSPRTIARVKQAAAELGYVPNLGAKQLVTRKSNLIGVFMPEFEYESIRDSDDFFSPLRKALRLYRKEMLIFSVPFRDYKPNSLTEWVRMRGLEGCVFMQPFAEDHPLMEEAHRLKIPSVSMGSSMGPHCSLVRSDDYEGGRMAGTYLAGLGHRTIGYVNGPERLSICEERYRGFCDALKDTGITHDAALVEAGDFSGASGSQAADQLLHRAPELTAICCANDLMAMGAMLELYRRGVMVPQRISVMGYDGAFFTAYTTPPITTVRHSFERIGTSAAELLVELLNGGGGRTVRIAPELVVRESVTRVEG